MYADSRIYKPKYINNEYCHSCTTVDQQIHVYTNSYTTVDQQIHVLKGRLGLRLGKILHGKSTVNLTLTVSGTVRGTFRMGLTVPAF